ncbi:ABC transporter ATP-binding protein [Gordonia insulae]|uniref:High-affinity branched-chain amino acid transport ATP-binding protein LivF n=1 Tax=Gordonia insulae TaxID=2420509 RepID=A0A3G8JKE0_9ACTN|nr:ATP-binding cassette domain-containing protein [Gordonia insulae]AZG45463.1 High-affinity branched-chain amino acid transport ATP-binding protein LivF [Gordonia insulae]
MTSIIAACDLEVGYGPIPVLHGLELEVNAGEVVALLGPNGSGKTTTLMALAGALSPSRGEVRWKGEVAHLPLYQRTRHGLSIVTEERSVVMSLTARQNLRLARVDPEAVVVDYPELADHLDRKAGLLSGGQQQILTLARALARRPDALLADELSLGLAPQITSRLLTAVRSAADSGMAVLLVEQHVRKALQVADRVYVLRQGRIDWSGTAAQALANQSRIESSYLGGNTSTATTP